MEDDPPGVDPATRDDDKGRTVEHSVAGSGAGRDDGEGEGFVEGVGTGTTTQNLQSFRYPVARVLSSPTPSRCVSTRCSYTHTPQTIPPLIQPASI